MWGRNIWAFSGGRFWAAAAAFVLNYACYYTGSAVERDDLVEVGWNYEGIAWNAPVEICFTVLPPILSGMVTVSAEPLYF